MTVPMMPIFWRSISCELDLGIHTVTARKLQVSCLGLGQFNSSPWKRLINTVVARVGERKLMKISIHAAVRGGIWIIHEYWSNEFYVTETCQRKCGTSPPRLAIGGLRSVLIDVHLEQRTAVTSKGWTGTTSSSSVQSRFYHYIPSQISILITWISLVFFLYAHTSHTPMWSGCRSNFICIL